MGWSANRDACLTLEVITAHCIADSGQQNVYHVGEKKYMLQVGREQGDGAICATIYKFDEQDRIRRSGSMRIEGNGTISRGPSVFKKLTILFIDINGIRELWRGGSVTQANLDAYIADWRKSYAPGGCNEHIGISDKTRFPNAEIRQRTGETLMIYQAPSFIVD